MIAASWPKSSAARRRLDERGARCAEIDDLTIGRLQRQILAS
jgi:hypothetical protein